MKRIIICTVLILMTTSSFCQQTDFNKSLTQKDYLQKSKRQKTAAWVLLGVGVAVAVTAPILSLGNYWNDFGNNSNESETPYDVAFFIGCASMLGSIPLFIASGRNKRKAMKASASFEIRRNPVLTNTGLAIQATPTVSLKLNF